MLKKIWKKSTLVVAASLLATGCVDKGAYDEEAAEIRENLNDISQTYGDQPRLTQIIYSINGRCSYGIPIYYPHGQYHNEFLEDCEESRERYLSPIANGQIKVELSTDLPRGAVVQIFQGRILINNYLSPSTQETALKMSIDYISFQEQDGVEYGVGETFTIGNGQLINLGKNGTRQDKYLIPAL